MKGVRNKSKLDEDFLPVNGNPFSLIFLNKVIPGNEKKFKKSQDPFIGTYAILKVTFSPVIACRLQWYFLYFLQTSPCHLSTGNLEIKVSLTLNCRFNTFRLDEHQFEKRRDRHFNCAGTIAKVDHTMQNFSTHGSPNSVSILLCNG